MSIRPIAIYLPQFHPIPENDTWWGKDFTDWVNVRKARPHLRGHYQPHVPGELGYYDLRNAEIREKQAVLAKDHGFYGFCYYHYWFNGKRLLNHPIDEVLTLGKPDFPFCLAWANENWTRAWDGHTGITLLEQKHSYGDDLDHIRFLSTVFRDERYIRVDGKPLFVIYQPALFPDIPNTLKTWRDEARRLGIGELYLCYFENILQGVDPHSLGFDASIEFQPNWWKLPPPMNRSRIGKWLMKRGIYLDAWHKHMFLDYPEVARRMIEASGQISYKRYPCVTPMFDNCARRKVEAAILIRSTPESYAGWLETAVKNFKPFSRDENFVFINAWNEWGEGNHLEPCRKWGRAYLEASREVFTTYNRHQSTGHE